MIKPCISIISAISFSSSSTRWRRGIKLTREFFLFCCWWCFMLFHTPKPALMGLQYSVKPCKGERTFVMPLRFHEFYTQNWGWLVQFQTAMWCEQMEESRNEDFEPCCLFAFLCFAFLPHYLILWVRCKYSFGKCWVLKLKLQHFAAYLSLLL